VLPAIGAEAPSPPAADAGGGASLEEAERRQIVATLKRCGWVVDGPEGAARVLGLHASTLRSRMNKLGIRRTNEPAR
jgi:transcriptional regulator with GAF, ATPase, and Fis domain